MKIGTKRRIAGFLTGTVAFVIAQLLAIRFNLSNDTSHFIWLSIGIVIGMFYGCLDKRSSLAEIYALSGIIVVTLVLYYPICLCLIFPLHNIIVSVIASLLFVIISIIVFSKIETAMRKSKR